MTLNGRNHLPRLRREAPCCIPDQPGGTWREVPEDPLVLLALQVTLGERAGAHEAERLVTVERLASRLEVQAGRPRHSSARRHRK